MPGADSDRIREALDGAFREIRAAAAARGVDGLERETAAGWTAKAMLAHVAFWEEAGVPVVTYMLRGLEIPDPWEFGSGPFVAKEHRAWPPADVHNAREAAWAAGQSAEAVLARWDAAHEELMIALETVTDAEAARHAAYFADLVAHLRDHLPELERLTLSS